jgi:hypothetical protein
MNVAGSGLYCRMLVVNALSVGREIAAFWSFPMSMLKNTNHLKEAKKG